MNEFIDISVLVRQGMPIWPGESGVILDRVKSLDAGDSSNSSRLSMSIHSGTHVDAPFHFLPSGKKIDEMDLDIFIGPVRIIHMLFQDRITSADLISLNLPPDTRRLLFRTKNSDFWKQSPNTFQPDFVGLTEDAAEWVADSAIELVGIDYLSIQPYNDASQTHCILLQAGVAILEGLDLTHVEEKEYDLICLPLRLLGAEGAPARAVLRKCQVP
jgi:arylformamidase